MDLPRFALPAPRGQIIFRLLPLADPALHESKRIHFHTCKASSSSIHEIISLCIKWSGACSETAASDSRCIEEAWALQVPASQAHEVNEVLAFLRNFPRDI